MAEPIIIYDKNTPQDGFDNNGIAILCPSSCQVTKELQGGWSATLEHPIDPDGIWKTLQIFRYVKICGQLFTVMNTEHSYDGNTGRVTAYLEHITYKMNDWWIYPKYIIDGEWFDTVLSGGNGWEYMLDVARQSAKGEYEDSVNYSFELYSDISLETPISEKLTDGKTTYQAMMDFAAKYDGEIFRDNFRFSICKPVANSRENAFEIRVGVNLTGIKRKVDVTTFCTHFTGYDNFGDLFAVSYAGWIPVANHITRSKNFNYDDESRAAEYLARDCQAYFDANLAPDIEYNINLRELKRNPDYSGLPENYRYEVGDTGFVYDTRFGGKISLRITGIKYDGITGEVTSVQFKNIKSFVYEDSFPSIPDMPAINSPEPPFEEKYTPIEYIETSGTQYIDCDLVPRNVIMYIDATIMLLLSQQNSEQLDPCVVAWGKEGDISMYPNNSSAASAYIVGHDTSGNRYWNMRNGAFNINTKVNIVGVINEINGMHIFVNGVRSDYNMSVKKIRDSEIVSSYILPAYNTHMRIYGFRIFHGESGGYENDYHLMREFIPVIRQSDGKPGLLDTVTNRFFTNAGTGEFITP